MNSTVDFRQHFHQKKLPTFLNFLNRLWQKCKSNEKKFQVNVILRASFCINHLTEVEMPELMSLTAGCLSCFNPITQNIKSLHRLYIKYAVSFLILSFINFVTLCELLHFSGPQFPINKTGVIIPIFWDIVWLQRNNTI